MSQRRIADLGGMLRAPTLVLAFVAASCASPPAPRPTAPPSETKPAATTEAPASESRSDYSTQASVIPLRKLAPGKCVDTFDCTDSVGFPPAGQRWSCVDGKCVHVKMPNIGGQDPSPSTADNASSDEPKRARKKSKRRGR